MENSMMLILGAVLCIIAIMNMKGNISTIHSYNRKNVQEEDIPKYGKMVGSGTLVIGIALIVSYILPFAGMEQWKNAVMIPALAAGLALIVYGQIKYNKGLF